MYAPAEISIKMASHVRGAAEDTKFLPRTLAGHQIFPSPAPSITPNQSTAAVQRTAPIGDGKNMPYVGNIQSQELSLMDKLKAHYHGERTQSAEKIKATFRFLFQFQAITQLYMTLNYLVPFVFSSLDPWGQYYLKVLVCYVFIVAEANWLATICYKSTLPDFRDRPSVDFDDWFQNPPDTFGQNGHIKTHIPTTDRNGLEWTYCTKCERYKPPRAHHCNYCKTCILRRDHHCYLVGCCIGHYNQRYFVPLLFYANLACIVGLFLTVTYLKHMSDAESWWYYIYPVAMYKLCFGSVSWQFAILVFHSNMLIVFGFMAIFYFPGTMGLVIAGKTMYEMAKQVDVKVNSSVSDNLRLVFGDYWFLNFFFPAVILFKQRHDGISYDNLQIGKKPVKLDHKQT